MALTLTQVQRTLLELIESVESDDTTPEEAVRELETLKGQAQKEGLTFRAEYTLEDFQRIRTEYASEYDESIKSSY